MKSKLGIVWLVIALSLLAFPLALLAHHGSAMFDETKGVTVKGVVTDWLWANPHCLLQFDAKDDKGNTVHWAAELSNPSDMVAKGWSRKMFKPGDEVTLIMIVSKNGDPVGRIVRATLNGKTYEGFGQVPGEPSGK